MNSLIQLRLIGDSLAGLILLFFLIYDVAIAKESKGTSSRWFMSKEEKIYLRTITTRCEGLTR